MPPTETGRGRHDDEPRPVSSSVASAITRLAERLDELDAAELTVAGGDTVAIVCVAEVRDWLLGQASRARSGVPL
jgi:hypothetical protein